MRSSALRADCALESQHDHRAALKYAHRQRSGADAERHPLRHCRARAPPHAMVTLPEIYDAIMRDFDDDALKCRLRVLFLWPDRCNDVLGDIEDAYLGEKYVKWHREVRGLLTSPARAVASAARLWSTACAP